LVQEDQCNTQHCGVDCVVTDFTEWSNCSKVCGGGVATRSREIFVDVLNGTLYAKSSAQLCQKARNATNKYVVLIVLSLNLLRGQPVRHHVVVVVKNEFVVSW
jgi:hypothetical protein